MKMKQNKIVARAHKSAERRLQENPGAPYSRINCKSLCMLAWIEGYRDALRDAKRDALKAQKKTGLTV